jgi:hypothetical protein
VPIRRDRNKAIQFDCPSSQDVGSYLADRRVTLDQYERLKKTLERRATEAGDRGGDEDIEVRISANDAAMAEEQARLQRAEGLDISCGKILCGSGLRTSSSGWFMDWLLIEITDARSTSNKVSCFILNTIFAKSSIAAYTCTV